MPVGGITAQFKPGSSGVYPTPVPVPFLHTLFFLIYMGVQQGSGPHFMLSLGGFLSPPWFQSVTLLQTMVSEVPFS